MKMNHKNSARKLIAAAVMLAAVATLSVGAFAAGSADAAAPQTGSEQASTVPDDYVVAGYLPPMPMDQMIQGDIMMIGIEGETPVEAAPETAETTEQVPLAAGLTMTGLPWKEVLFTARQEGAVLTLDAPEDIVTVRGTIGDLRKQMAQGIGTLSVVSNKNSTTLNLTLLCEGYADNARFTLRQIGSRTFLTIGGRCRRDLLIGR